MCVCISLHLSLCVCVGVAVCVVRFAGVSMVTDGCLNCSTNFKRGLHDHVINLFELPMWEMVQCQALNCFSKFCGYELYL